MGYIFLTYAKADHDTALTLRIMLENEGFRVWMDMNKLELGKEHWPLLEANIQGAAALVLVVSDAARQSKRLKHELTFAESIQKPIFPILVQGEGWEGLQREPLTLGFGLNLDFPETYLAELKALLSGNDNPLPAPISIKLLKPADKNKKLRLRWIAVLALIIAICIMLLPIMKNHSRQEEIRNLALTSEASRYISMTSTAISREATDVQLQMNASMNLTGTAARGELLATATEAANAAATERYGYWLELTATTGSGTLPCTAIAWQDGGVTLFSLYERPSFASSFSRLRRIDGEAWHFRVNEWIVNEDGAWYGVSTPYTENMGYVLAEELELDETCPR